MSRISSTQMTMGYLKQLQRSYDDYNKLLKQGDGNKLHKSSDDSVAYSKYLRYQNSSAGNTQYQKDVKTALSWMKATDDALTSITDLFATFSEKTVNASNETNNESDMKDIAKELFQEIQEVVVEMNRELGDRYLFAGQADNTMPYMISANKMERGETKTLNEQQKDFFEAADTGNLSQFLVLQGSNGKGYYLDTNTGNVFDKEFVDEGYKKDLLASKTKFDPATDVVVKLNLDPTVGPVDFNSVGTYFKTNGVINDAGKNWNYGGMVDGQPVDFTLSTVKQYVANYFGDDKKISMVTQTGATNPFADTVNVTGQQVYGSDIFDYQAEHKSGSAILNEMLTAVAKIDGGDSRWAGDDGLTITDVANKTILNAQTTVAARYQAYEVTESMLITQQESLAEDIGIIGGADIAVLATHLAQSQTIYSLSLGMGSKLFPGSLADYL